MCIRNKLFLVLVLGLIFVPLVTVKAETKSYNTPNTTIEDSDKKSECEVTADIHYAYYISLPASLVLEPWNTDKHFDICRKGGTISGFSSKEETRCLEDSAMDRDNGYYAYFVCPYQVKAKTKSDGLGGKYLRVYPERNFETYNEYRDWDGEGAYTYEQFRDDYSPWVARDYDEEYECYWGNYFITNGADWPCCNTHQKKIYFGDIDSKYVTKIDSSNWSTIYGFVSADIAEQGQYKGNFDFVYGLVDSIE